MISKYYNRSVGRRMGWYYTYELKKFFCGIVWSCKIHVRKQGWRGNRAVNYENPDVKTLPFCIIIILK